MKIVELRPDSKLLKGNFDGYKLSLEPIPILKQENIPVDVSSFNSPLSYFKYSYLIPSHF